MTLSTTGWPLATTILAAIDLAKFVNDTSIAITCAAVVMLITLIVAAITTQQSRPAFKKPLYTLMVVVVAITTFIISSMPIITNLNSPTNGPVRWATDYQIWACGNQLNLRGPQGILSNRVGTTTLFELQDNRIHFEGTPLNISNDTSLGKFMQVVDGQVTDSNLIVPVDQGSTFIGTPSAPEQLQPFTGINRDGTFVSFTNGASCDVTPSEVQAFVYRFNPGTDTYTQTKITHPAAYEMSHTDQVPPGDCVVLEFAPPEDHTDHLCPSYGVRDKSRCVDYGVPANKTASCTLWEVR